MLEWRLKAYRHWLTMKQSRPGRTSIIRPIDYQAISLLLRAEEEGRWAEEPRRSRSQAAGDLREARASRCKERGRLAGVAVDAVFDSVSVATTFKKQAGREGHYLLLVHRGGAGSSGAGEEISWDRWCLTRTTSSPRLTRRVFTDGSFCLHPQRRALSDGAFHLLPHQRGEHRPVRAHADRGRRRRSRELPGRLHGADAG